jgi:hypothetical protein
MYEGHCYVEVTAPSWFAAYSICKDLGMDLAALTTAKELYYVTGKIDELNGDAQAYYRLGGTDQLNEGVWKWTTGEPWTSENDEMWASSEPDGGAQESCLFLDVSNTSTGLFRDEVCQNGSSSVCESL